MTSIKELQESIQELVKQINATHNHEKPELISYMKVVEEVGEITKVLLSNQIKSRKSEKRSRSDVKEEMGSEISDCIIALLSLANDFDIDVSPVIQKKLQKHYERNVKSKELSSGNG